MTPPVLSPGLDVFVVVTPSIQLFSYLSDKDLLAEIFHNQLAKRILDGRSTSDDAERSMISKLKLRCGAQFTGKMEGMITDLSMGDDQRRKFREFLANPSAAAKEAKEGSSSDAAAGPKVVAVSSSAPSSSSSTAPVVLPANLDFGVQVLTTGFWPTYELYDVTLPSEMAKCVEVFSAYYAQVTSHRQLKWVLGLGQATIRANMKKPYDLQVTTLQSIALLNMGAITLAAPAAAAAAAGAAADAKEGPEWVSFDTLKQRTNMDDDVLKRVMHSLACGKYKVLRKSTDSKGVSKNDKFKINTAFACPLRKVRLPMASLEKSHNPKRVQEDRSIAIEAAVVRIMKARKQLAHHLLVTEVLQQLHFFKPNPKVVKKRIEHLIDREYLERDEDSPNIYRYLA
jgi:cullin 1